jgi:primase-polymerase (primpol)-like protein
MTPNALPIALRDRPQWVCWASRQRNGKQTKVPLNPDTGSFASTANSATWGSFDRALRGAMRPNVDGIGFVFTDEDPYVGVDLDDCRDPDTEQLSDVAIEIVMRLQSYTEISPSGTGLHVIARGTLPDGPRRCGSVEMYDTGRFFTMTGDRLASTPSTVCTRPSALESVHHTHVAANEHQAHATADTAWDERAASTAGSSLPTDEALLERARSAENGEKFSRLWAGDISGYDSHSEADMALCCLLAFWTAGDGSRIDELFRQSGLMRSKWDEVHYADGSTYGEKTIERACTQVTDRYEPPTRHD